MTLLHAFYTEVELGKYTRGMDRLLPVLVSANTGIPFPRGSAMAEHTPKLIILADSYFSSMEQKSNVRLTLKDKKITIKRF